MEPRIRFNKVREVRSPQRAHSGDAGIDFYIPSNLTLQQLRDANASVENIIIRQHSPAVGCVAVEVDNTTGFIKKLVFGPQSRIRIPSGIRALIEPEASMLKVGNKSGISALRGLTYTAEIVDTPYTGEIHLCCSNDSGVTVVLDENYFNGKKAFQQLIHQPVYLTIPEEISDSEFETASDGWSDRGDKGFSSTDEK